MGPPGLPQRVPGEGQKPPEDRKTRRVAGNFQKTTKNKLFENVHHSRVPGPFWPKRVADRTPITTVGCVFRRGLKSGPREPKERKSAPARFLKALNKLGMKMEENKGAQTTVFYEAKRP